MSMKKVLVGGPLLGTRFRSTKQDTKNNASNSFDANTYTNWDTLEPIVTDPIRWSSSNSSDKTRREEQLVLLPNERYISVLSYKTGKALATYVPQRAKESLRIVCVTSTTVSRRYREQLKTSDVLPNLFRFNNDTDNVDDASNGDDVDHVLLVGCTDGTIQEFDICSVFNGSNRINNNNNNIQTSKDRIADLVGPCYGPRRVFDVSSMSLPWLHLEKHDKNKDAPDNVTSTTTPIVQHITVASSSTNQFRDDIVVYVLVTSSTERNDNSENADGNQTISAPLSVSQRPIHGKLIRIMIPLYHNNYTDVSDSQPRTSTSLEKTIPLNYVHYVDSNLLFVERHCVKNVVRKQQKPNNTIKVDGNIKINNDDHHKTLPFCIKAVVVGSNHSVTTTSQENGGIVTEVIIIVACSTTLILYRDKFGNTTTTSNSTNIVEFDMSHSHRGLLSTIDVSPNQCDIACGHFNGAIQILINVIPITNQYYKDMELYDKRNIAATTTSTAKETNTMMMMTMIQPNIQQPVHPSDFSKSGILVRKLHWHAHPLATLQYDYSSNSGTASDDGILFSGGHESVLVVWQLSQGSYRPTGFMPRIAMGGIVHMKCCASSSSSLLSRYGMNNSTTNGFVLMFCADNSLQLVDSRNTTIKWKIQGLATGHVPSIVPLSPPSIYSIGSTKLQNNLLVLSGLPKTPGSIHWYDPREQLVVKKLEVVPFNRISSTESNDILMPTPTITHAAWSGGTTSNSTNDLVTIDIVPTENASVGRTEVLPDGTTYGTTTTIRFWWIPPSQQQQQNNQSSLPETTSAATLSGSEYYQVATMPYPHGRKNRISAIAISPNGRYVCTVSNDEKAFRFWQKNSGDNDDDDEDESNQSIRQQQQQLTPQWSCRCKVSTPSAFSNFLTGASAVSFSSDSTVVAIGFGTTITLWDFHSVTLLASHRHGTEIPSSTNIIDQLLFVASSYENETTDGSVVSLLFPDTIITKSRTSVVMQSAYGEQGPLNYGWIWELPYDEEVVQISLIHFIPAYSLVAIILYDPYCDESCIVLVNAVTGGLWNKKNDGNTTTSTTGVVESIKGEIVSMSCMSSSGTDTQHQQQQSQWKTSTLSSLSSATKKTRLLSSTPLRLFVLTSTGEMIAIVKNQDTFFDRRTTLTANTTTAKSSAVIGNTTMDIMPSTIPLLSSIAKLASSTTTNSDYDGSTKKRTLPIMSISELEDSAPSMKKKGSLLLHFGSSSLSTVQSSTLLSTDLPRLQGSFTRCFLARNLQRN